MVLFDSFKNFIDKREFSADSLSVEESQNNSLVASDLEFLDEVYLSLLGRKIDPQGMRYFKEYLSAGGSREDVVSAIKASDEFQSFNIDFVTGDMEFLDEVYLSLLGRKIDPQGMQFFKEYLSTSGSRDEIIKSIMTSDEFQSSNIKN